MSSSFEIRSLFERIGASGAFAGSAASAAAGQANIYSRVGAPVGASISADVAAVQADIGDASAGSLGSLYAILGNPAESYLTKIGTTAEAAAEAGSALARLKYALAGLRAGTGTAVAANKSLVDAIGHDGTTLTDVGLWAAIKDSNEDDADSTYNRLGNPTSGTLTSLTARIGDNASSRSLHALLGDHATTLHAKVGATAEAAGTSTLFAHAQRLYEAVDSLEASMSTVQGVVRFTSAFPQYVQRPSSGSTDFRLSFYLYDSAGNMEDPDADGGTNTIAVKAYNHAGTDRSGNLKKAAGTDLDASTAHSGFKKTERASEGAFSARYRVDSTHAEEQITFEFAWKEASVTFSAERASSVSDAANDLTAISADVGDASAGSLGSIYGILGNAAETFLTKVGTTAEAEAESGSVLARLKFIEAAVRKGAGTSVAVGKSLVDAIGHTGSAALATGLDGKLGTGNDQASTANTLLALVGDPLDAAVTGGSEGSVFAKLRGVYEAVDTLEAAATIRKGMFTKRPFQSVSADTNKTLTGNPTAVTKTAASSSPGVTTYLDSGIMFSSTITSSESGTKTVDAASLALHWNVKIDGNATSVKCKWMVVSGASATVTGAEDLTDEITETSATAVEYSRSGNIKLTAMDTLPFTVMLVGKTVDGGTGKATGSAYSDCEVTVSYSV